MDERKVEVIWTWPTPSNHKQLQRFIGFVNFYRGSFRNYSSLVSPFTDLLKGKPKALSWTPEAIKAMSTLQKAFTSVPILVLPDPNKPFLIEVDASQSGVGAVLSQQQGKSSQFLPCALFSRKMAQAEKNYDIGNQELLDIKALFFTWDLISARNQEHQSRCSLPPP